MVIKEIEVKDVLTKTNLPVSDYAVNPYAPSIPTWAAPTPANTAMPPS